MGWHCCLDDKLRFPFQARCIARRIVSPLREGETVRWHGRVMAVPLSQLAAIDPDDATAEAIGDWHYWWRITRHRPVEVEAGHRPKLRAEELFRGARGYLALELWGKDKDLSGCVRPQFFTRSGEEIELPFGFGDAVKAVTSGAACLNCSHPHYSRRFERRRNKPRMESDGRVR